MNPAKKKLSFCITCKNRIHQISKTLFSNLDDNRNCFGYIEFILVDFDSTDGLREFICENFKREIEIGYLRYYYSDKLLHWHSSIAKNIAHSYAAGDIVVNLDCDNFTGKDGAAFVIAQFDKYGGEIVLHQASGKPMDGSFGRISVLRDQFEQLGGYDESFYPMGYQDVDLIKRLVESGLTYIPKPDSQYNMAIENTKAEGLINSNSALGYKEMNSKNMQASIINISSGNLIANQESN